MTQFQFELICKSLQSGVPALADELCDSLNDLVVDRNQLAAKVEEFEKSKTNKENKPKVAEVKK